MSRIGSQVPADYTWYASSQERRSDGQDPANPTNNIVIPLKMPRSRLPVIQMNLGSIELPMSQFTVENLWNRLYFSEGIRLIANTLLDSSIRQFTVQINGVTYTAELPLYLNPVVNVDTTDPSAPILTTQFNHALDTRGSWNWGATSGESSVAIQLISSELTQGLNPELVNLTASNPNLTVLDDTRFRLSNVPPGISWNNPSGVYAYLMAPTIPNPVLLASIVTDALNIILPGVFRITYSTETGQFTFLSLKTVPTCSGESIPSTSADDIYLVINTRNSLAALMGFGVGTVPVPVQRTGILSSSSMGVGYNAPPTTFFDSRMITDCDSKRSCRNVELTGGYGFQCVSEIHLPEGNYTADTLRQNLYLEWDRMYFEPGKSADSGDRANFVFSDGAGVIHTISIPFGMYTPDLFSEYLETQMNFFDTQSNTYSVMYDAQQFRFCFWSTNSTTFGLEFGSGYGDTVHPRIGFQPVPYRGSNYYCSTDHVYIPVKQCCGSEMDPRYSSYIYSIICNSSTNKFCIHVNKPRILQISGQDLGNGLAEITTMSPAPVEMAHGYQIEDVISLQIAPSADPYQVRVVEIVDALTFRVDLGSLTAPGSFTGATGLYGNVIANLFFNSHNANSFPARYLGFPEEDQLWPNRFCAPFSHNLAPPAYVLVYITQPDGATHNNHAFGESNISNVFAKIILYPQFRMERLLSFTMYLPQMVTVTDVGFLILNPDHTPYQFHGKDWSASVIFSIAENTSSQQIAY